jgi:hypothetical protein
VKKSACRSFLLFLQPTKILTTALVKVDSYIFKAQW